MSKEEEPIKSILRKLISGSGSPKEGNPDTDIVPLTEDQRKNYPHVIYQLESNSPVDRILVQASFETMRAEQFPIAMDTQESGSTYTVIVRAGVGERHDERVQSALFLGLTEATRRRINTPEATALAPDLEKARAIAGGLLHDLTSKPKRYEAFRNYYGGLRWHFDQEKFVRELFVHGTEFNPAFLDEYLKGGTFKQSCL